MTENALIGPVAAPELHVMTYNIRRTIPHLRRRSPDRWERRAPLLQALLAREQPTVLGTQEATPVQTETVLRGLGDSYRVVGQDRGPDDDERNCVYWNADRLRLLKWEQRALSDTPHIAGSRTWGNPWPRIVVTALFADNVTGCEFVFVNTHLDPVARRSRLRSAAVLADVSATSTRPVIMTGDFNTGAGSKTHQALTGTVLRDLWESSPARLTPAWGTYANYRRPRPGKPRIDWILGTAGVAAVTAGINAAHADGWASDHLPVQAVVRMDDR